MLAYETVKMLQSLMIFLHVLSSGVLLRHILTGLQFSDQNTIETFQKSLYCHSCEKKYIYAGLSSELLKIWHKMSPNSENTSLQRLNFPSFFSEVKLHFLHYNLYNLIIYLFIYFCKIGK